MVAVGALAGLGSAAGAGAAERIDAVAGSGTLGVAGDGGPAIQAALASPSGVARQADGSVLIADTGNHRIRRVAPDGTIGTIAGGGPCCGAPGAMAGDGLSAADPAVRLNGPRAVALHPDGRILIADTENHVVRAIGPSGVIERIAGDGTGGYGTEGGPALVVRLNRPSGLAVADDGAILVADTGNNRVLRIAPGTTTTTRIAGVPGGSPGYDGDGVAATTTRLDGPAGLAALPGGGLLIADAGNHRIRRIDGNGTITTVAGSGATGPLIGDGTTATLAALSQPQGVAVDAAGGIVIADSGHHRVRAIGLDGTIRTVAGSGTVGGSGDGGDPSLAALAEPRDVAAAPDGPLIADTGNHRVRQVQPAPPAAPPEPVPPSPPAPPAAPPVVVPEPTLRRAAVATPVRGRILVRLPGTRRFVVASSALRLPIGSEVDARGGTVAVRFRTTSRGTEATATVSEGRFVVRQSATRDGGHHPGVVVLSGPLHHCPKPARKGARSSRSPRSGSDRRGARAGVRAARRTSPRKRRGRRVTVSARGKIKTRGKYGAATVRGTRWTMIDRCRTEPRPGTLTIVREGRVVVDAFVLRTRRSVRAGQRYLAPARRR